MRKCHLDRLESELRRRPMTIFQIMSFLDLSHSGAKQVIRELKLRLGKQGLPNIFTERPEDGGDHLYFISGDLEKAGPSMSAKTSCIRTHLTTAVAQSRSLAIQTTGEEKAVTARLLRDLERSLEDLGELGQLS